MPIENPFKDLSKNQRYAVIAGGALIGGYAVYHHHSVTGSWNPFSKATAASSGTAASGIDPITGLAYSDDSATDPITGMQYLAEAEQYGSVATAEAATTAYGQSTATGSGIPVNPASPASSGSINTPVGTNIYTSNAAWSQAATAGLVDVGYQGTDVASALGAYLTQTPETPAQAALVKTAIAEFGPAPVGNLQIVLAPASGPGAGIPNAAPTVSAGHIVSVTKSSGTVAWTGNNASKYVCTLTGPGGDKTQTVTSPTVQFTGLQAAHNYSVQVLPYNSSGTAGLTGHVDFQTLAH
jgi:hypothetical protein